MADAGIFTTSDIIDHTTSEGSYKSGAKYTKVSLVVKYTLYAEDGSSVSTTVRGEGDDQGDKAGNKALAVAHKYALLQMFMIPTEDAKDPEDRRIDPLQNGQVVAQTAVTIAKMEKAIADNQQPQSGMLEADDIPFGDVDPIEDFEGVLKIVGKKGAMKAFSEFSKIHGKSADLVKKAFKLAGGVK